MQYGVFPDVFRFLQSKLVITVLFFQTYCANCFCVFFAKSFAATGALSVLFSLFIKIFSLFVKFVSGFPIVISEKFTAVFTIRKLIRSVKFLSAPWAAFAFLSFEIYNSSFRFFRWHFSPHYINQLYDVFPNLSKKYYRLRYSS